jgi:signal transduction histidine kinase
MRYLHTTHSRITTHKVSKRVAHQHAISISRPQGVLGFLQHGLSRLLLVLWLALLATIPAAAQPSVVELTTTLHSALSLSPFFQVLEDPSASLTLADVQSTELQDQFQPSNTTAEALSFGFTRSAYWLRLTLHNPTDLPQKRMLEVANYALSHVDFYQPSYNTDATHTEYHATRTGAAHPFASRAITNRFYVFPVQLPAHSEQVVYLRIAALDGLLVPARLWTEEAFNKNMREDYMRQSVYYGITIAMVLFNLLLFLVLRERMFLLYVVFELAIGLALASFGGLMHEFVWPHASSWSNLAHFVGWNITLLFGAIFIQNMLWQAIDGTAWIVVIKYYMLTLSVAIFGMLLVPSHFLFISVALNGLGAIFLISAFAYSAYKQHRPAYFLLGAFSMIIVGTLLTIGRGVGLLESNFLTVNGLQIGSALEMIILALALADRFNQIRKEKAADQLKLLQAEQALVKTLQSKEEELQQRVQERTAQLEAAKNQAEAAQQKTEHALQELQSTQTLLVAAEKMATLGLLVSNVAHEINTPIGAVQSSGQTVYDSMHATLENMPKLLDSLGREHRTLFLELIDLARQQTTPLPTREERAITKKIATQLDALGIEGTLRKARLLVRLGAYQHIHHYLPLLTSSDTDFILSVAAGVADVLTGTNNINLAAAKVAQIVASLKQLAGNDRTSAKFDTHVYRTIEAALATLESKLHEVDVVRQYQDMSPLHCDPDALQLVWAHLINNALHASQHRGVIMIGLRASEDGVEVRVADFGCGMSPEIQARAFEPFFTTRASGEGGGMGLSIAKNIIEAHHGSITLLSESGIGTTVTVTLPHQAKRE